MPSITPEPTPTCPPFRCHYFPDATDSQWNDWCWHLAHSIRTPAELLARLPHLHNHPFPSFQHVLPLRVTPYYLALINPDDPADPLLKTILPCQEETLRDPFELSDPLAETSHSPLPGLVHRYPDRVLFLLRQTCPLYCRYCTRKRLLTPHEQQSIQSVRNELERKLDYIATHPEIHDVLLSGGEPLLTPPRILDDLLARLRQIPHLDLIRFSSKLPVVLPVAARRPELLQVITRHQPLYINLHLTHPREITGEFAEACHALRQAGAILGSQTVLLRDINDSPATLAALWRKSLKVGIRPYYLLQCDLVHGSSHFRVPVERALEILAAIQGRLSGLAIPKYMIDLPNG
ncbi:MAG: KamA family radical SAM protein, partial [Lentisphaerae bacterium]